MKSWIALAAIVAAGAAAVVVGERQKIDTPASPQALLHFVGDTQQELTRLPMRLTRLSDDEEIRIGNELARAYGVGWKPEGRNEDEEEYRAVQAYVDQVGARVAGQAHRRLPYRFHYVPSEWLVNAFALPGGHVVLGAGLLSLMDSEDELAAVLGHEIEHVDLGHCAERVQVQAGLRKLNLGAIGDLLSLPVGIFQAGYSKEQELAADREGTGLAVAAGYSPLGAVRMFETFQRLYEQRQAPAKSPQQELSQMALQTLDGYFRSHPASAERIRQIDSLIAERRWNVNRQETDLGVGYIFWSRQAGRQLSSHQYEKALGLAKRSLQLKAGYLPALLVWSDASYYSANFLDAAGGYRRILETDVAPATARLYAAALAAAAVRGRAVRDYSAWLNANPSLQSDPEFTLELAGLKLLAGDDSAARKIGDDVRTHPEPLGRLGWWYYRAGRPEEANRLLAVAVQQRPQFATLQMGLGWVLVERRQLEDALQRFGRGESNCERTVPDAARESPAWPRSGRANLNGECDAEAHMGKAVAWWLSHDVPMAVGAFSSAAAEQPSWLNPQWVAGTQPPLVARSVAELQAEREKEMREAQKRAQANAAR
jgi:predicted Zn-dependent protease